MPSASFEAKRGRRKNVKILVSNIGSTSFKFRLFDCAGPSAGAGRPAERELASGGVDRIGGTGGVMKWSVMGATAGAVSRRAEDAGETPARRADGTSASRPCACRDHGAAIASCLDALVEAGALVHARDLDAVAFKAVLAGDAPAVAFVTDEILAKMEYYVPVAPMHNPVYIAAMRSFRQALAGVPLVAAFEPGFHRTVPPRRWQYACPPEWTERFGIRRYGYHGASHRYVAGRVGELLPQRCRRIISCHLGGSSSVCAIRDGASVATSMGFSPQSGLPQGTRVGDFDPFALAVVARETGQSLAAMLEQLGNAGGLAGLSGTSGDARDIEAAYQRGDERATLTLECYATAIRDCIGAFLVELGGVDSLVFTGGIGEKSPIMRELVCKDMEFLGISLDPARSAAAKGECRVDSDLSKTAIWAMPTNEELVVARQAVELLRQQATGNRQQ